MYVQCNNILIRLDLFVKINLYNKNFDFFVNKIETKESNIKSEKLVLLVFIGDEKIGQVLINKIKQYNSIENFALSICLFSICFEKNE